MDAKAFISHKELTGTKTSELIRKRLSLLDLKMESFLSKDAIVGTDHIPEKVLQNIAQTDFLIVVVEDGLLNSGWVEWEHNFCVERGIKPLYVVFPETRNKLHEIPYLDLNLSRVDYEDFNDDKMLSRVGSIINAKNGELEKRANEKKEIVIDVNTDKQNYLPNEVVTVSGSIKKIGASTSNNFSSTSLYLHIPNTDPKFPPASKKIFDSIKIENDSTFRFEIRLEGNNSRNIQTWFAELRFDNKAEIIPITICPSSNFDNESDSGKSTPGGFTPSDTEKIRKKIQEFSSGTYQSIPKTIKDFPIERSETKTVVEEIEQQDRIVLTGDKGSGKSVLLCQIYEELLENSKDVLFVRCDDYLSIDSINDLQTIVSEANGLDDILSQMYSPKNRLIILFDSLDAISRNSKSMGLFKQFLKILWGTNSVKTICSVRTYDFEYSSTIRTTDWGRQITLDTLSEEQVEFILTKLGNPSISNELLKILKNPLHLKLLSLILKRSPDTDFTKIKNEIELYDEHWNEYIEKSEYPQKVRDALFNIAKKMIETHRIIIPYEEYGSAVGIQESLRQNIIDRDLSRNFIQFFHHAYLDYVISKFLIQQYETFVDFVLDEEYNIFLRPTIIFALSFLFNRNPNEYTSNVEKILNSELKFYWKISTLNSFARIDEISHENAERIGKILDSKPILQRHFLREVARQENVNWFVLWKDSFIKKWFEKQNANDWFLIGYAKVLSSHKEFHEELFSLLKNFVAKEARDWDKKTAIEITSKFFEIEKFDWYLELSQNENSFIRWGIIESLLENVGTEKKDFHKIFNNIFLYDEPSDEKTIAFSYGTFGATSTKRQDSRQIIWRAGELFPKLLQKNPDEMILAIIRIIEKIRSEYLTKSDDDIVEDGGYIWYGTSGFRDLHDEGKLLSDVKNYLNECEVEKIKELSSVLSKTKSATIHNLLLEILLNDPENYKELIFNEISKPVCYKIETLRRIVRQAINKTSKFFSDEQVSKLFELIMSIQLSTVTNGDEKKQYFLEKMKAEFISEFPTELLKSEHKELLAKFPKEKTEYKPSFTFKMEAEKAPEAPVPPNDDEIIENDLGKELEHNDKIRLLNSIGEYLGRKTDELDPDKLAKIKDYLVKQVNDSDPKENADDKDSSIMFGYDTIRGLTAKGLMRLYYHTKDKEIVDHIEKLSEDSINIVRGEIARELQFPFFVDFPLTLKIATKYSLEKDYRVQFFLSDIIEKFARKYPDEAIKLVRNILYQTDIKNFKEIQFHEDVILYLALKKNHPEAKKLLSDLIEKEELPKEIKLNIPFTLKENYLFDDTFQDESLEIFLKLLDDGNHEVREKATFFLLATIDGHTTTEVEKILSKIEKHLDKIITEMERKPWDPRIIEELVRFLEKFWEHFPIKSIDYLEKIAKDENYSAFQPVFARGTVKILTGVFQQASLSTENRNRCLNILDTFAMAGWEEALNLLSSMERSD